MMLPSDRLGVKVMTYLTMIIQPKVCQVRLLEHQGINLTIYNS